MILICPGLFLIFFLWFGSITYAEKIKLPEKCETFGTARYSNTEECGCKEWSQKKGRGVWKGVTPGTEKKDCIMNTWQKTYITRRLSRRGKNSARNKFQNNFKESLKPLAREFPDNVTKLPDSNINYFRYGSDVKEETGKPFSHYGEYFDKKFGRFTCVFNKLSERPEGDPSAMRDITHYLYQCRGDDFCCDFNSKQCCYEIRTATYKLGMGSQIAIAFGTIAGIVLLAVIIISIGYGYHLLKKKRKEEESRRESLRLQKEHERFLSDA